MHGEAATWDIQTELAATSVELLQLILKANGVKFDFTPIERPFTTSQPEPEKTVSASQIMDFLKGI